ncbi:MAG: GAF domain-containing protein [Aggregatilineales bacterium]
MNNLAWLRSLLTLRHSYRPADRGRAQVTLLFSFFFVAVNLLAIVTAPIWSHDANGELRVLLFTVPGLALGAATYLLTQSGRLRSAAGVLTAYLVILGMGAVIANGIDSPFVLTLAMPLVYVGLSFGPRGVIALDVLFILEIVGKSIWQGSGHDPFTSLTATPDLASLGFVIFFEIVILLVVSLLLGLLAREQQRAIAYGDRLVAQLRATAQLAQATSATLDLDELLQRTVDYIRDQFAFYHVQVFLVDKERRYATLAASTGDVGAALLERGHRLAIGSQSIIGRVTLGGTPVVAQDTADDPLHRANDLLPATRSELAVPLIAGDQVIGSLDVQSTRPNAFLQDDVDSLQIVASQVSIAVRNAQLFAEQKTALAENQRLLNQAETNLSEIERLNQRLSQAAWGDYLRTRQAPVLGVTLHDKRTDADISWTPGLTQAMSTHRPVIAAAGSRQIIAVPIDLNGRAIGAIEVEVSGGIQQAELVDLIKAVAGRVALSLENARLFEQAQTLAQQELTVNAISARMQSTIDVDELLRTTLTELGRTLGATSGSIRLGSELAGDVQTARSTNGAGDIGNGRAH